MMPVSPKYYYYYKDDCRKGQEWLWAQDLTESFSAYFSKNRQSLWKASLYFWFTKRDSSVMLIEGGWGFSWLQNNKTTKIW